MNSYNAFEKREFDFRFGMKPYPAEIHTIEAIGSREVIIGRDRGANVDNQGAIYGEFKRLL